MASKRPARPTSLRDAEAATGRPQGAASHQDPAPFSGKLARSPRFEGLAALLPYCLGSVACWRNI